LSPEQLHPSNRGSLEGESRFGDDIGNLADALRSLLGRICGRQRLPPSHLPSRLTGRKNENVGEGKRGHKTSITQGKEKRRKRGEQAASTTRQKGQMKPGTPEEGGKKMPIRATRTMEQ